MAGTAVNDTVLVVGSEKKISFRWLIGGWSYLDNSPIFVSHYELGGSVSVFRAYGISERLAVSLYREFAPVAAYGLTNGGGTFPVAVYKGPCFGFWKDLREYAMWKPLERRKPLAVFRRVHGWKSFGVGVG